MQLITTVFSRKILVAIIGLSAMLPLKATHIVGGYISYKCLGNNTYEITMRMYRDSVNANASYPAIADIDIVIGDSALFQTISVPKQPTNLIPFDTLDPCKAIPPNILIQYVDYIDTVTLPPHPGGYVITFGQCCRNGIIDNIANPQSQSSRYIARIPPDDTLCNSSPQLVDNPPLVLCHNRPIDVKIDVQEPDGDSVYFELCDIFSRNPGMGAPCPECPPYQTIPYSYMLPATPSFDVDPQTGQLLGEPTQIGHFVVAICMREFRDGRLLNTVQLDYQFNVTSCVNIFADMITQEEDTSLLCKGTTIQFTDQSQNANEVFWDFGDTTTTADTSSQRNPIYSFPNPGVYRVMLVAGVNDPCADTIFETFIVQDPLPVDFSGQEGSFCFDDQPIQLKPEGSYPDSVTFSWYFGPNASVDTVFQKDPPPVSWNLPGKHYVTFTVHSDSCDFVEGDTIEIRPPLSPEALRPADNPSLGCNGLELQFVSTTANATRVRWDFGDPASTADTAWGDSASYDYPQPGEYQVTLIAYDSLCTDTLRYTVEVFEELNPSIEYTGINCFEGQNHQFSAGGSFPDGTEFTWNFPQSTRFEIRGRYALNMTWPEPGSYPVQLTARKKYCEEVIFDTIHIEALTFDVNAGDTQTVAAGQPIHLEASQAFAYYWGATTAVNFDNRNSRTPTVEYHGRTDSSIIFILHASDRHGCQGVDSTIVYIQYETPDLPNVITPNGDGRNDYFDISDAIAEEGCALTIMNRWGSVLYRSEPYQNDWNGVNQDGEPLEDGTYYYVIYCHPEVKAVGPITILRDFKF